MINGKENKIGDIITLYPNYANAGGYYSQIIGFTNKRIKVRRVDIHVISKTYHDDSSHTIVFKPIYNSFIDKITYVKKDYHSIYDNTEISEWIDGR